MRKLLKFTDGSLVRPPAVPAQQDLVRVTKGYQGQRPRTWVEIHDRDRAALPAGCPR
ncbi:hypothetical protein [Streptomyces sp. NPDC048639]|uniref:hypothetical protein n=1 Tax=Streptomyces sp. NPDC048639 TaxID=3365581 RepID=UPI003717B5B5